MICVTFVFRCYSYRFLRDLQVAGNPTAELISAEMNVFDAALALMALGHLGEGGRRGPFKAYEWNKMKTPIRILVGGPEVTSAFVLMGLVLARRALTQDGSALR